MKTFFFTIILVSLGLFLLPQKSQAACIVTTETDATSSTDTGRLRYKVEQIYNRSGSASNCDAIDVDRGTLFEQSILFATPALSTVNNVQRIRLRSRLTFSNTYRNIVIGNWSPFVVSDPAREVTYSASYRATVTEAGEYGVIQIKGRSGFGVDVSPFVCAAGTENVYLRNMLIETNGVTQEEFFDERSSRACLKNAGAVYICPGILRGDPNTESGDIINLDNFTPEQLAGAWCDADGDGSTTIENDCDDTDRSIHPGAVENCEDAIDNNCDGRVNEGCGECMPGENRACGSGVGECSPGAQKCLATNTWEAVCIGGIGPVAEICDGLDNDCDGRTDEGVTNACGACGTLPAEVCDRLDNDCDGTIDEGVTNACGTCGVPPAEVCDGIDNDCDGMINEGVTNACGTCGAPPVEVCDGVDNDCDGATDEGVINACGTCGAPPAEVCDGADNDCDGVLDEGCICAIGATRPCGLVGGTCVAGIQTCTAGAWGACVGGAGPAVETCDGLDNDCNGTADDAAIDSRTWYEDADSDLFGNAAVMSLSCTQPVGFVADNTDCDDTRATVSPRSLEVCGDGLDNDCDGITDEIPIFYRDRDGDSFGDPAVSLAVCLPPAGYVVDHTDCNDLRADAFPGGLEVCGDGVDQDCNGADTSCPATDTDHDGDGFCTDGDHNGLCGDGTVPGDCNDGNAAINPNATEICDGIDNNCDSIVDFADTDGDGYFSVCPTDCDDGDDTIHPGAPENCGDGIDQDCDGRDDACPGGETDDDGDGYCEDANGDGFCDDGTLPGDCDDSNPSIYPGATEICGNGIDDNCNGDPDFGDPACFIIPPLDCNDPSNSLNPACQVTPVTGGFSGRLKGGGMWSCALTHGRPFRSGIPGLILFLLLEMALLITLRVKRRKFN